MANRSTNVVPLAAVKPVQFGEALSERWADDPAHYRAIGLDYEPKSS